MFQIGNFFSLLIFILQLFGEGIVSWEIPSIIFSSPIEPGSVAAAAAAAAAAALGVGLSLLSSQISGLI